MAVRQTFVAKPRYWLAIYPCMGIDKPGVAGRRYHSIVTVSPVCHHDACVAPQECQGDKPHVRRNVGPVIMHDRISIYGGFEGICIVGSERLLHVLNVWFCYRHGCCFTSGTDWSDPWVDV